MQVVLKFIASLGFLEPAVGLFIGLGVKLCIVLSSFSSKSTVPSLSVTPSVSHTISSKLKPSFTKSKLSNSLYCNLTISVEINEVESKLVPKCRNSFLLFYM